MTDDVTFKFRNLEITRDAAVLHFYDEKTVIPLTKIKSYHLQWHLHDPTFAKKWWFLVLTVELEDGHEESGPVAFVKFEYLDDRVESRRHIERRLAEPFDTAMGRRAAPAQKMVCN